MSERFFDTPDLDKAKQSLADEEKRGGGWNASFYKPQQGVENVIRILPAPGGSGADWHIKVAKHFVKHPDGASESFVCMKEMYGQACPACEEWHKLPKGDPGKANYSYRRSGVFNVIDRNEYTAWYTGGKSGEAPKVKLYEAPIQAVWYTIVQLVSARGRQSHIFDDYDENGNVKTPGRDWIIYFNPKLDPQSMYRLVPSDPCPLGTPEEIRLWLPQIIPLIHEKIPFYAPISYEEAAIKTFGSPEERKLLKESKKAAAQAASAPKTEEAKGYPSELDSTPEGEPETGSDGMGSETIGPESEALAEEERAQKEAEEELRKADEAAKKAREKAEAAKQAKKTAKPPATKPAPAKPETPKTAPVPTVTPPVTGAPTTQPPAQASLADIQAKIASVRAKYAKK